jgi:hypothetical protein
MGLFPAVRYAIAIGVQVQIEHEAGLGLVVVRVLCAGGRG